MRARREMGKKVLKFFSKRKLLTLAILFVLLIMVTGLFIWATLTGRIRPFAASVQIQNTASYSYTNSTGQQVLGQSNTVAIQITSAPTPPSNLMATANSSTQITISWTDNSSDETGFKIERSPSATGTFTPVSTTLPNITTYIDSGLAANTAYYYRVYAYNLSGNSTYSNVVSATTKDVAPAAPTSLATTATADKEIDLAWVDNSNNETGFKIERSLSTSGFTQIGTTATNINIYKDKGLTAGTTYYYQVKATNSTGDSGYSNVASSAAISTPASPSNLSANPDGTLNVIHLNWQDNATNETGFEIQRMIDGTATWTVISNTSTVNVTSYDDTTVSVNILYWYQVRTYNAVGYSAFSNIVSAKIIRDTQAPAAPTNLTGTATSYSQINLSWTASTDNVGVTGYYIYRNGVKVGSTTGTTSYSDNNLFGSTTYTYYVTAFDAAGNESAASNPISVTTPAPPDNPPQVTITNPADGATVSGTVNITANATDDIGVAKVWFYIDGIGTYTDTVAPYAWSWDTTGYTNGPHSIKVRAYDTSNQYNDSDITVTVNNPPPQVTIANVSVSATPTTATFKWTTNLASTPQVCYGLSSPSLCTPVNLSLVTSHSVIVIGLLPRNWYQYQILSTLSGSGGTTYSGRFRTGNK